MKIDHSSPLRHDGRKIPKMRREPDECPARDKRLSNCNCNRQSIAIASASAQLVDNGDGPTVNVAQYEGGFAHLGRKGAHISFDRVVHADTSKKLVLNRKT